MSGEEWIERAEAALAASGHKRGGARSALLELMAAQTCVLSVADIERAQTDARRRSIIITSSASAAAASHPSQMPAWSAPSSDSAGRSR